MRIPRLRFAAFLAAVGALALVPAVSAGHVSTGAKLLLSGGGTTVAVHPGTAAALQSLGVGLAPTLPAQAGPDAVTFPIPFGFADEASLAGQIRHIGGLALTKGDTRVELRRFFINIDHSPDLTGLVSVNGTPVGRVELFSLDLAKLSVEKKGRDLQLSGVGLKLTQSAADALNNAFGTSAFTDGLTLGTATVETRVLVRLPVW